MKQQNKNGVQDEGDEKSNRRDRFNRKKATGDLKEDSGKRPRGERYHRSRYNFNNMSEDDFDELLDEE